MYSRYCRQAFRIPLVDCPPAELLENLGRVARQIGRRAVLMPTTDEMSVFAAEYAKELEQWFIFPKQDANTVRSLACKRAMYGVAKRQRIATAQTYFPRSRADVVRFASRSAFPVMLKGINVMQLWRAIGKRMFVADSAAELVERYDSVPENQRWNLLLQEYIPGGDDTVWMFNGYFNQSSDCVAGYTGRKLRQCPVNCGVASLGVCESNEEVAAMSKQLIKSMGYHGAVDIDYKYDPRDGRYKVLDVNPRIGASFRMFVSDNGMDVARAFYLDVTGQTVTAGQAVEGRKWIVEDLDTVSCIRYAKNGGLRAKEWLHSYEGIAESAYFAADDPLPLFGMWMIDSRKATSRLINRIRQAWSTVSRATGDLGLADGVAEPLQQKAGLIQ